MKKVLFALLLAIFAIFVLPLRSTALAANTLQVERYCRDHGKGKPYTNGRDWYCEGSSFILSVDQICRWQSGPQYRGKSTNVLDPQSWTCEKPETVLKLSRPLPSNQKGLDVYRFCLSHGKGSPFTRGRDWYCEKSSFVVSMNEVCRWQNGENSRAVSDSYMDPFSWRCEQ